VSGDIQGGCGATDRDEPVRRVAVVGGTFDPPHNGHVALIASAREQLDVEAVVVVVAGDPWQKSRERVVTPAAVRLEMVALALDGLAGVEVSDLEVRRAGPTYTYDTVVALRERSLEPVLVVGSDVLQHLSSWHRLADLADLADLAVVEREPGAIRGHLPMGLPWGGRDTRWIDMPRLAISSRDIRERIAQGRPIDGLVPPAVVAFVAAHGLYREAS
jgi:nicotinate-nucleotide adenylyltransferase